MDTETERIIVSRNVMFDDLDYVSTESEEIDTNLL